MVLDSRVWLERVSERERWVVASGGEGWNGLGLDQLGSGAKRCPLGLVMGLDVPGYDGNVSLAYGGPIASECSASIEALRLGVPIMGPLVHLFQRGR